ncbi:MAG: DUF1080 domain-containing protein [Candidatus Omnitrophota bacterium]
MIRRTCMTALTLALAASLATAQGERPVMGNWHGEFAGAAWKDKTIRAQVVGESWDEYRAVFFVGAKGVEEQRAEIRGKTNRGVTHFEGRADLGEKLGGVFDVTGDIVYTGQGKEAKGSFDGVFKNQSGEGAFSLKRVLIKSPTLGMKPPESAIMLFDGTDAALNTNWVNRPVWVAQNGLMKTEGYSIYTKEAFGDAEYHVEFVIPYMPRERGQARGNSGVYIAGRYEVQVLDSFADHPENNLCGGIYQQATPIANACLPPLEAQTYDITFLAPRFDANGNKIKDAEITVKQNGVVIHDHVVLKKPTPGGVDGKEAPTGQLLLQDHGNSVPFGNVWVKPLK